MKRILIAIVIAALLLAGCNTRDTGNSQASQSSSQAEGGESTGQGEGDTELPDTKEWEQVGTFPQWYNDAGAVSFYSPENKTIVVLEPDGTTGIETPLTELSGDLGTSLKYCFSPNRQMIATSQGIVDIEGNVLAADFPQVITGYAWDPFIIQVGWLNDDVAFVLASSAGIFTYTMSTGEHGQLTPEWSDLLPNDDGNYNAYGSMADPLLSYKLLQVGDRLFYRSHRDEMNNNGMIPYTIYTATPAGEELIAADATPGVYDAREPVAATDRYLLYVDGESLIQYDFQAKEIVSTLALDYNMWPSDYVADNNAVHYAFDYSYEGEFLVVQRTYDSEQIDYNVPVYAAIEQEVGIEANSCWLLYADQDQLYINFQCGVDDNDWIKGVARYNKQTGTVDVLGSFSTQTYTMFEMSPGADAVLAYTTDYDNGEQPFHIIKF